MYPLADNFSDVETFLPSMNMFSMYYSVVVLIKKDTNLLYTVKKVIVFPVPSRDVTNQTLPEVEFTKKKNP